MRKNHTIKNKLLDVKKALPKNEMDRMNNRGNMGMNNREMSNRSYGGSRSDRMSNSSWGSNRNVNSDGWSNSGPYNSNGNFNNGGNCGSWNSQPTPWNNSSMMNNGWNQNNGNYNPNPGPGNFSGPQNNGWTGNDNFGCNYQQGYGGGPVRSNNYGNVRNTPYNSNPPMGGGNYSGFGTSSNQIASNGISSANQNDYRCTGNNPNSQGGGSGGGGYGQGYNNGPGSVGNSFGNRRY